ncbi:hypothetical protein GLOTRDRAFT_41610 [Gloeophyllum trabeum ATCC 11539]|uniref:Uncharacterized protein n=1 Tax=Gloeophyllum trabeum (strain ATCC 11539 / FP-39264 / Madison 617) TaxID=670483 RepID=S7RSE1_GLOTA|nr:uncharacterized protein GLOTRDRAFT_41610 [Gloeophyllum trabeum ATCC 11539]EPQ55944.1 hypothetical protein GLOTRDRAFT_41610 [Gloeophyllum trabeum ATCC 11539]
MSSKTLSNGTLSLRFMQRAKLVQQAEAEKAEVKDDSQWEISSKVKQAWGLSSGTSQVSEVAYESSYLPFLFPSASEGADSSSSNHASSEPKGRRKYNAKGQEVEDEVKSSKDKPRDWSKMSKRPVTISGSTGTVFKPQKEHKKDHVKPAKMLIHENAKVGTDLRAERSALRAEVSAAAPPKPSVFLKPSGVDDPAHVPSAPTPSASSNGQGHVHSQGKANKGTAKRSLDRDDESLEGEGRLQADKKKRRKKKNSS